MITKFYSRSYGLTVRMIHLFVIGLFMMQITMATTEDYEEKEKKWLRSQLMTLNAGGAWVSKEQKSKDKTKCDPLNFKFYEPNDFYLIVQENFFWEDEKFHCNHTLNETKHVLLCQQNFNIQGFYPVFEFDLKTLEAFRYEDKESYNSNKVDTTYNFKWNCKITCEKEHALVKRDADDEVNFSCDRCYKNKINTDDWHECRKCDYDACQGCLPNQTVHGRYGESAEVFQAKKVEEDQKKFKEQKEELSTILAGKRELKEKNKKKFDEEQQNIMRAKAAEEEKRNNLIEVKQNRMKAQAEKEKLEKEKESNSQIYVEVGILIIFLVGLFYLLFCQSSLHDSMEKEIDSDESYEGNVIEILPKKHSVKKNKSKGDSKLHEDEENKNTNDTSDSNIIEDKPKPKVATDVNDVENASKTENSSDSIMIEEKENKKETSDSFSVEEKEENDSVVNSINLNTTESFIPN